MRRADPPPWSLYPPGIPRCRGDYGVAGGYHHHSRDKVAVYATWTVRARRHPRAERGRLAIGGGSDACCEARGHGPADGAAAAVGRWVLLLRVAYLDRVLCRRRLSAAADRVGDVLPDRRRPWCG